MRTPIALLLFGLPSSVWAQSQPFINVSPIPNQRTQLNVEWVEDDVPIQLEWRADTNFTQSYRYEITYDNARSPEQPVAVLIDLDDTVDAGRETGTVIAGQTVIFRIRPTQILRMEDLPQNTTLDDDDEPQRRDLILQVFIPGQEGDQQTSASQAWTFEYDTRLPPAPTLQQVLPGEDRVIASWSPPGNPADVEGYEVVYCPVVTTASITTDPAITSTTGEDLAGLPCTLDEAKKSGVISLTVTTLSIEEDVLNGIPAAVAIRSVDEFGNRGALSDAKLQTPAPTTDYWELYKGLGGEEEGGFCFVATAAHGSYAHPVVRVLRLFRDRVLKATPAGTGLVWAYYRYAPPAAEVIRHDEGLRTIARVALLPIALVALIITLLPLLGLGVVIRLFFSRLRPSAALLILPVLLLASPASAKTTRPEASGILGYGLEFKGGPYLPDMATDPTPNSPNMAFGAIFETNSRELFHLGFDVQIYRGFGTAGVGGSFGFMQFTGKGVFGLSPNKSLDTTVFNIMPLSVQAFYRFDWIADRFPIPLVPYLRGGLAYYVWWVTTGTGDVSRFEGSDTSTAEDDQAGRGGKFGVTGTLGLALMLNHLEPNTAQSLYNATGIRGTYLFGEITGAKVDGFGKSGFDFSDMAWNLGIYFEF